MFLEIVTRTFGRRPQMLARNQASLARLESDDWQQTLVVDDLGRGVAWACANLATVEARGEYLWVLDDDDVCCRQTLVDDLKGIVAQHDAPQVIMARAQHTLFGLLPSNATWGHAPVCGDVGTSCFVVRRDVWEAHRSAWQAQYEADYLYIRHLWDTPGIAFHWWDALVAMYPQRSLGAAEYAR